MALRPTFSALIRWRGPDPTVEIETRHPGFCTPEDAALYGNGISPSSPAALRLFRDAVVHIVTIEGRSIPLPSDAVTIWVVGSKLPTTQGFRVANDTDFELCSLGATTSMRSAHGEYQQAQYGVLDQDDSPLDVRVDWDEADHLRVTVEEKPQACGRPADFLLGSLPEA